MKDLFEDYQERLAMLEEPIAKIALKYAKEFYFEDQSSKEEALEKGIVKAQMEKQDL